MTSGYVPARLRRQLRAEGGHRCVYCRSSERVTGMPLEVERIVPRALGGRTSLKNLCLACHRCNEYKRDRMEAEDFATGQVVALFNPRSQRWLDHFRWSRDGIEIVGITACGRATVDAIKLNNPDIVAARHVWVAVGLHPPAD